MASKRVIQFECQVIVMNLDDEGKLTQMEAVKLVVPETNFAKTFQEVADSITNPTPPVMP